MTPSGSSVDEDEVNDHEHGLYPPNVLRLVEAVASATGMKPDPNFVTKLRELNAKYQGKFTGKAVALTPPTQYILHWLGYKDVVVLVKEHGQPPAPQDMQKALQYAKEGAPVVAAVPRAVKPKVIDMFVQKAQEAGFTPRIIVANFSTSYLATLEKFAEEMSNAKAPTTSASQVAGVVAGGETSGVGQSLDVVWIAAAVAVLLIVAAFYLARRRKK